MAEFVATATTEIDAPPEVVWRTLTDPAAIKRFMFDTTVQTDWQPGSPIVWKGEYDGRAYEDKGEILAVEPERRLQHTHFSALSGRDDVPENYHTLTYTLEPSRAGTLLTLTLRGDAVNEAETLKQDLEGEVDVYDSLQLAGGLMARDQVDELRITM